MSRFITISPTVSRALTASDGAEFVTGEAISVSGGGSSS